MSAEYEYTRKPFTDAQNKFLRENVKGRTYEELAELFNQEFGTTYKRLAISKRCRRLGLTNGRTVPTPYPSEQLDFLREHADGMSYEDLSTLLDEHFGTSTTASRIGELCRRHGFSNGIDRRFSEGHSVNLGRTFDHALPDGSEMVNIAGYIMVKHDGKWRTKHSVIWEQAHGQSVPKEHIIVFGDNDKRNFNVDNLHCVSRPEMAILISRKLRSDDPELAQAGVALAKLYAKINERKKGRRKHNKT
jgi:transposase